MHDEKDYAPGGVGTPRGGELSERFGGGSRDFINTNRRPDKRPGSRGAFAECFSHALAHALILASQGRRCFPCQRSKRPASPHGFQDATAEPEALRALWSKYPGELIGVSTGRFSGIDVLDIDAKHVEARQWWATHRDRMPATRAHRTRSRGLHVLFQHAPGMRCSAGRIAPGIDVRGDGGYVIWWPARGLPVLCHSALAPWPDWLRASAMPLPPPAPRITVPDRHALAGLIRLVAFAREGERNRTVFWAACRAGEMVRSGLVAFDAAAAVIAEAATRAGLPRVEAERTVRSAMRTTGALVHG